MRLLTLDVSRFECPRLATAAGALLLAGAALTGCAERAGSPTDPSTDPVPSAENSATLASALTLVQVSAGKDFTCGVAGTGLAYCWGQNFWGNLGNGTTQGSSRPVQVTGGFSFRQISTGYRHACAVTTDNRLYCWGAGRYVGLALPPDPDTREPNATEPRPLAPALRFLSVSAGVNHTCAVTVGGRRAYCWGANAEGQLGDGTTAFRLQPVRVNGAHAWKHVSVGNWFTCGITTANVAWCWGRDASGELGDGPTKQRKLSPARVAGNHQFTQIGTGEFHACAITTARRAWCWGEGVSGAIGDGQTLNRFTPRAVVGGHLFDRVTGGYRFTCAEADKNETYCWGINATTAPQQVNRPWLVVGGFRFVQVDAGSDHACGRTSDAVVRCWGDNATGELGDGTTTPRSRPTVVVGG